MAINSTVSQGGDDGVVRTAEDLGAKLKKIEIEVNSKKIQMPEGLASGLEIKQAAIGQGVSITVKFVLQQEMPNGTDKVIGDDDKIEIRAHMSFTAIAPDDNS